MARAIVKNLHEIDKDFLMENRFFKSAVGNEYEAFHYLKPNGIHYIKIRRLFHDNTWFMLDDFRVIKAGNTTQILPYKVEYDIYRFLLDKLNMRGGIKNAD